LTLASRLEKAFDFVGGEIGYRFQSGNARKHPLAKAAGFARGNIPAVADATAGFGRDAFLLASMGARVTLIERSPEVYAFLEGSLARAGSHGADVAAVVARMTLLFGDARDLLPKLQADVIVVDPMHPPRRNTALVKQEMRLLRELVGTDRDALQLMSVALSCPCRRVVLKWPLRAQPLTGLRKPSYQISQKTVRYDVFLPPMNG
jgi:16S rRNA (guanine1516-N2)-methyltransferase